MEKEQSNLVKQLYEGGYEVISGYVTYKRIPIGTLERFGKYEIINPGTISPPKVIEKHWGSKERTINNFIYFLKSIGAIYRENKSVIQGKKITSWEDCKKELGIFD